MKTGIPPTINKQIPTIDLTAFDWDTILRHQMNFVEGFYSATSTDYPIVMFMNQDSSHYESFTLIEDITPGDKIELLVPNFKIQGRFAFYGAPKIWNYTITVGVNLNIVTYEPRYNRLGCSINYSYYSDNGYDSPTRSTGECGYFPYLQTVQIDSITLVSKRSVTMIVSNTIPYVLDKKDNLLTTTSNERTINERMTSVVTTTPNERITNERIQSSTPINRKQSFRLLNLFRRKKTRNEKEGY